MQGELDILNGTKSSVTARKAELNLEMEAKLPNLTMNIRVWQFISDEPKAKQKLQATSRAFDEELDRQSKNGSDGAKVVKKDYRRACKDRRRKGS